MASQIRPVSFKIPWTAVGPEDREGQNVLSSLMENTRAVRYPDSEIILVAWEGYSSMLGVPSSQKIIWERRLHPLPWPGLSTPQLGEHPDIMGR